MSKEGQLQNPIVEARRQHFPGGRDSRSSQGEDEGRPIRQRRRRGKGKERREEIGRKLIALREEDEDDGRRRDLPAPFLLFLRLGPDWHLHISPFLFLDAGPHSS